MTDLCWSFWKADSILPLGPAQRKPWIRPAIMTAPSPRKVGGLWMYNPGGCGALCLNDCCLIHLRSRICGKVNLQEQLGRLYPEAALCMEKGFIALYKKIAFKVFVRMKPAIIPSSNIQCVLRRACSEKIKEQSFGADLTNVLIYLTFI